MGALLTKVPPMMKVNDNAVDMPTMSGESTPNKFLDPRSPNPFRTPISELAFTTEAKPVSRAQNLTTDDNISTSMTVTPTKLRSKLLRDLMGSRHTLDPRSPALNFDRTPITFNNSTISDDFSLTSLSLNESAVRTPAAQTHPELYFASVRSPSVDIERTPLVLNAKLLNESQEENEEDDHVDDVKTPTEEQIIDDATVVSGSVKNVIYMDENQPQPVTPNVKTTDQKMGKIRTPLSCLMNAQSADNRNNKRLKTHPKTILGRAIFKDAATANHNNSGKMNANSSSKIPVLRKSLSKEIN